MARGGPGSLRVNNKGWQDLKRRLGKIASVGDLRIGIFDGELATIFATHEFGSRDGRIPERSSIRLVFIAKEEQIAKNQARLTALVLDGKLAYDKMQNILGEWLAGEVKKAITTGPGIPPPNSPSTLRYKTGSRPLVDTGRMVGAITYKIVK